jgi:lysophospholipase L1-like esterase
MNARGERILIFGDSLTQHASGNNPIWDVDAGPQRQSSGPGDLLASLLLDQGAAAVRTNALVSRSAINFWTREAAPNLIAADLAWHPSKIIFLLGTNDVGLAAAPDEAAFARLRDAYRSTKAEIWAIGPFVSRLPAAGVEQVAATMRKVFGARFLDGRALSTMISPGSDGVHYAPTSARLLALNMADALLSASPPRPWLGIAIGMGAVIGAGLIFSYARTRRRGLAGIEIVNGKRWGGSTNELVRSGYAQVPCKSGLDTKGLARCWTRGLGAAADDEAPALYQVRIVRGRALGVDAGTIADVVAEYDGKIDLRIEQLDMTYAGVDRDHPDIERVKPGASRRGSREPRTGTQRQLKGDPDDPQPGEDDEAWWQRLQRRANEGKARVRGALEEHPALILTTRGGRKILVLMTPEMSNLDEGSSRITTFDEDGPIGHTTRPSIDALADEVYRDWHPETLQPASEAEIMEWTGTERFARGAAAVAEIQRRNQGGVAGPSTGTRRQLKLSSKDPAAMTPAQINTELDKLDKLDSALTDEMIAAGRGHERPSEYLRATDPLSVEMRDIFGRRTKLHNEIALRYGPGAPRRMPPGFKARELGASSLPPGATFHVDRAARAVPKHARFGSGHKVFIADVHDELVRTGVEISPDDLKRELVRMHQDGNVVLARADFVGAMNPRKVAASETRADGATFHFVVID